VAVCTELQVADVVWVFEPNMQEVRSDLRKLYEEEIRGLYSSLKNLGATMKEDEMGGACSRYGPENKCLKSCGERIGMKECNWKTQA